MNRLRGPEPGQLRDIGDEIVIGREGDVRVEDPQASRRHAAVRPVAEGVEVEDLGSSNGTFVNGERVEGKVTLRESATLRIGHTELELEIEQPELTRVRPTPAAPDVTVKHEILQPDVTAQRPVAPDVTRMRPPPEADAPAPAGSAPVRRGRKRLLAFGAAGLGAAIAVGLILAFVVFGGGSTKKTPAALKPRCAAHFPTVIRDGFPEPPMIFSREGVLSTTLTASTSSARILGVKQQLMEFNKIMPGPTLVLCPGDLLRVDLQNKLPIPMNLHVHGLHVSPTGDGDNVFISINPFQDHHYRYQLPLDHDPGAFWYHPHHHGLVNVETTAGLIGAIIVQGGLDDILLKIPQRLNVIYGGKIVPPGGKILPIPGARPGQIKPPPNPGPQVNLVNGVYDPTLHIQPGQLQRWRIWNATGGRELKLALPGTTFQLLAKDGNTLRNMLPRKQLIIGAG